MEGRMSRTKVEPALTPVGLTSRLREPNFLARKLGSLKSLGRKSQGLFLVFFWPTVCDHIKRTVALSTLITPEHGPPDTDAASETLPFLCD